MKLLAGVILLCCAVATYAAPRVIGGKDAPEGKYKYQVSLRSGNFHFCGGSILNKRWILTAAHCVLGQGQTTVKVVAGTTLLKGGQEQVYQSEYVAYHKNFSMGTLQNDVAVVRVSKDIEFNDKVQPIGLSKKDISEDGHPVTLTGWGSTRLGGAAPNNLQEISLRLFDQKKCKEQMKKIADVTISHICTLTKAGEGACHGDSGGPLVADGNQVGIVSFGSPCAVGKPDVFTRVHTFLDWIAAEQAKFYLNHESVTVVVGTTLIKDGNEQVYQSEYVVAHKCFHNPPYSNDVALIRVNKDIEFNDKVQPIALPDRESYKIGDSVKLTGWGSTKYGGPSSNKLQEMDLKIFDQDKCKKEMQDVGEIIDSHICTLNKAEEGACNGDSGGPLVADGIQVGIVSFGSPPCAKGKPDVFTRVYSFLDWIDAEQAKF